MTESQQNVLNSIKDFIAEHGYPPSVRELGQRLGYRSSSTVQRYIERLEDLGHIKRRGNGSVRGIILTCGNDKDIEVARRNILSILEKGPFRLVVKKHSIELENLSSGDKIPL